DQSQHPGFVGTEHDGDAVGGRGAAFRADDAVPFTVDADPAALGRVPPFADDPYRFLQGLYCLRGGEPGASHRLDGLPDRSRAEPELPAAAAAQVDPAR